MRLKDWLEDNLVIVTTANSLGVLVLMIAGLVVAALAAGGTAEL